MQVRNCLWGILIVMAVALTACRQQPLYVRLQNIKGGAWRSNDTVKCSIAIADTVSYYRLYTIIRHTNQYAYRNIWLSVGLQYPGDTLKQQLFDLPLATTDRWLGEGMNDVFERQVLVFPQPVKFRQSGLLTITLQQRMRDDPLHHVLQAGIRVEPVKVP